MDDKRMELENFEERRTSASGRPDKHETVRRLRTGGAKRPAATANRRQVRRGRAHSGAPVEGGVEPRATATDENRGGVAESLELAPFAKLLYSSDAWGPPELHYLGAHLWRRAITAIAGEWVSTGDWSAADAQRVITMIGRDNARRVYRL